MKRALLLLGAVVATVLGIDWLADLTQNRPDRNVPGSRSEVVLDVTVRHHWSPATLTTAQGLWGACQHTAFRRLLEPGMVEVGEGRFRVVTEPALGENAWRRLKGCLEDVTVDRVKANIVSKRDFPPGAPVD
ncbi:MAG TPA: hypothetical protein VG455_04710 [Acidimicrobiales bacterium]|nr:hypothetical protein [Acidimicrobiales bacterium]